MGIWSKSEAENTLGYLKAAVFGFQGSGKTFSAVKQAIGLHKHLATIGQKPGPVGFFDTERGADFAVPEFKRHGVPLYVIRGRSFASLIQAIDEAVEGGFSTLIIDSATHVWRDLCDSYQKSKGANGRSYRLQFQDWAFLKTEWAQFTDRLVNAKIHMFVLGRAGHEYSNVENEDDSGRISYESVKTGTKFKAEGEFGFEPSIVFEAMRVRVDATGRVINNNTKKRKKDKIGALTEKHRMLCVKDRNMDPTTSLDGEQFDFDKSSPEFAVFEILKPHLACLNLVQPEKDSGIDTSDSTHMMSSPDTSRIEAGHRRKVLIEEIQEELNLAFPGSSTESKKARLEIAKQLLGTVSQSALDRMPLAQLEEARLSLDAAVAERKGAVVETKPKEKPQKSVVDEVLNGDAMTF